ncbi:hypothetical protein EYF80_022558 [Liparis tanakae]|uniref:Uncharacterized protein n=1 Tax=Liparis tanakae TaxID=230148 RepID=A0A4Z2HNN9_9TELE|nr:hypothetical protein EYF80_022558 [Liparis tanakae]
MSASRDGNLLPKGSTFINKCSLNTQSSPGDVTTLSIVKSEADVLQLYYVRDSFPIVAFYSNLKMMQTTFALAKALNSPEGRHTDRCPGQDGDCFLPDGHGRILTSGGGWTLGLRILDTSGPVGIVRLEVFPWDDMSSLLLGKVGLAHPYVLPDQAVMENCTCMATPEGPPCLRYEWNTQGKQTMKKAGNSGSGTEYDGGYQDSGKVEKSKQAASYWEESGLGSLVLGVQTPEDVLCLHTLTMSYSEF